MSPRRIIQIKVGIAFSAVILSAFILLARTESQARPDAFNFFDPIIDMRREIVTKYVNAPDEEKMLAGAIEGMIETLNDPYTNYFSPEQLRSFTKSTRGSFSGIGAEISTTDGLLEIVTPLEDSPAFKAGILAGDIIMEINGEPTEGLDVAKAVEKITGPEGTPVKLKVRHTTGEVAELTIIRARIEIQTVKGFKRDEKQHWDYMLDPEQKIGYIRMTQFSAPTYDALKEAITELKSEGMKGLILDLRFNPGGLLDSAIKVSDLFLDKGTIVSTKGRAFADRSESATPANIGTDFPIILLVNEGSASASEIVAGALKDNDRAIVLGTRTVGKGSVQQVIPLEGGRSGAIKLTTALYYLPSGRNIHKIEGEELWGVDPNDGFYVSMSDEEIRKMLEIRRSGDIVRNNGEAVVPKTDEGKADAPSIDLNAPVNAEWVEKNLHDRQLAAAIKAISAKIKGGEWEKVGGSQATASAHVNRRAQLQRQRTLILDRLSTLDKEITDLDERIAKNGFEAVESDEPSEEATAETSDEAEAEAPVGATE